jgi:hypothetical protein
MEPNKFGNFNSARHRSTFIQKQNCADLRSFWRENAEMGAVAIKTQNANFVMNTFYIRINYFSC